MGSFLTATLEAGAAVFQLTTEGGSRCVFLAPCGVEIRPEQHSTNATRFASPALSRAKPADHRRARPPWDRATM
jgi:hypothetical protein